MKEYPDSPIGRYCAKAGPPAAHATRRRAARDLVRAAQRELAQAHTTPNPERLRAQALDNLAAAVALLCDLTSPDQ